jgi:hypothetical protein
MHEMINSHLLIYNVYWGAIRLFYLSGLNNRHDRSTCRLFSVCTVSGNIYLFGVKNIGAAHTFLIYSSTIITTAFFFSVPEKLFKILPF